MQCVLYEFQLSVYSNSTMNIASLLLSLRSLKYIISISESLSEMRHGTLTSVGDDQRIIEQEQTKHFNMLVHPTMIQ